MTGDALLRDKLLAELIGPASLRAALALHFLRSVCPDSSSATTGATKGEAHKIRYEAVVLEDRCQREAVDEVVAEVVVQPPLSTRKTSLLSTRQENTFGEVVVWGERGRGRGRGLRV